MTTVPEKRHTTKNVPYTVHVPLERSSDIAFEKHLAEVLRQWFYRNGLKETEILTDTQLINRLRLTFTTHRRPIR